jgi:starch synthase
MNILLAASECTPFAKVGGLGDVIGALSKTLVRETVAVDVVLPCYKHFLESNLESHQINGNESFNVSFLGKEETCRVHSLTFPDAPVRLFLIRNDTYLSNGGIYLSNDAFAHGDDEPRRFLFFCKAVFALFESGFFSYDVVHCHDWHTSLLCKLMKESKLATKSVLSVHNLANVGAVAAPDLNKEVDGNIHPHTMISVGLDAADAVVPVSEGYARELLSGKFTEGLNADIERNKDKFSGITNGIDTHYFDPERDTFLKERYTQSNWSEGKIAAKKTLFSRFKWDMSSAEATFLVGMVGRIAAQKNIDLVASVMPTLYELPVRFVLLGVGDKSLESKLRDLSIAFPDKIVFANRFDEELARYIYAGSDGFLVPSLFEPCGLTQMIALRYGALPIGRRVGGLAETINSADDGFLIQDSIPEELRTMILTSYDIWHDDKVEWERRVLNGLKKDFSWDKAAAKYIKIYETVCTPRTF